MYAKSVKVKTQPVVFSTSHYHWCHIPTGADADSFIVKPKEKKLYMQWTLITANHKAVNVASAFPNDVALFASA